jgi:hypothetical protein
MFQALVATIDLIMLYYQHCHVSKYETPMLYLHVALFTFHKLTIFETNLREHVAHSCCKPNRCINEWNDAHAYEMQVQLWKPNTWGVIVVPAGRC